MQSLTGSQSLLEVTLDGNPVSDNPSTTSTDALAQQGSTRSGMQQGSVVTYRQKLICQIPNLRQLDMKRISVSDININVRFINCSQTKFVAIILVLSVFFFMRCRITRVQHLQMPWLSKAQLAQECSRVLSSLTDRNLSARFQIYGNWI